MLEKTMRINDLYDFYYPLLTEKQCRYMSLYYSDDYSLGEVADEFQVSRQAVYDTLRRTEIMLEDFEDKLLLFDRFKKRQQLLSDLRQSILKYVTTPEEMLKLVASLQKLE